MLPLPSPSPQLPAVASSTSLADWLIAGGTLASTALLLGTAIVAWRALADARRTRHAQLMLTLNDQWSSPAISASLRLYWKYPTKELGALVDKLYGEPGPEQNQLDDYRRLQASANLVETIGVLRSDGAITTEVIYRMWGGSILAVWLSWQDAVPKLREYLGQPDVLRGFEALSIDIQKVMRKRASTSRNRLGNL